MSSPKMNNIIVAGCIFIYSTVFVMRIHVDSSNTTRQVICIARTWALFFGFSLSFGALFAKTWRVYTIFNSPHGQKRMITDGMLFIVVVLLLCLDLILLITWAIVDPLQVEETELDRIEEKNTIISRILYTCESERMNIWTAITYSYKGLLLVIGCFFAWQTRHVNIPALNDSKYIGMSVYNVVIMSTSAVAISYVITSQQDHSDLIIGLLIILCTTITLCLVFVPKIMHLRQDPKGLLPRPRLSMKSSSSSRKSMLAGQNSSDTFTSAENKISQLERDLVLNQAKLNLVTQEMKSLASKCNAAVDSSTSTISNQVEHLSLQNFSQQCNTTTTHCTHSTNNEPTDEIARTQHTTAKTDCISVGSDSKL